eukprot:m.348565 g.348565  ORF g.348565 m.348565 type:complete len:57 (-) comp37870_c0_seq1:34-204(-)
MRYQRLTVARCDISGKIDIIATVISATMATEFILSARNALNILQSVSNSKCLYVCL